MNGDDKERDMGLDDQDEANEDQIKKLSQTTGVPAHGEGITGVRRDVAPGNDPNIIE